MASAPTLSALEEIFRKNMNQRSLEFGGISVALCGDPAQLPPIMNKVIYMPDQRSISGLRGFKLYCNMARFNTVILNVIKRSQDSEYTKLQSDIRNGVFSDEMIDTLNTRVMSDFSNDVNSAGLVPVITNLNVKIKKWYDSNTKALSNMMLSNGDEPPILLLADLHCKSCLRKGDVDPLKRKCNPRIILTAEEMEYVDSLPDTTFDNYPMAFYLYIGANCIIAKNIATKYQLANGTRGVVVGYEFPRDHYFKLQVYHGVTVRVAYVGENPTHVRAVFFKVSCPLRHIPPGQPKGLPNNTVALVRTINHPVEKPVRLQCENSVYKSLWVNISQVPLRTADMLTPYSVQGSQFDRYVIKDFDVKSFYQVISRGKNGLESIRLEKPITRKFADSVIKNDTFRKEIERLEQFHVETKNRVDFNIRDISSFDRIPCLRMSSLLSCTLPSRINIDSEDTMKIVVPMNGDESNYMSIMQRLESELSLPYFPGFKSCESSSIYWNLPNHTKISIWIIDTYSQSKRIHVNECIICRYFHDKLGCEVHLLRPPLISHQISSSCGLVGKDILTSIRKTPRMLRDENELTKIIEWATSKRRLLENQNIMAGLKMTKKVSVDISGYATCDMISGDTARELGVKECPSKGTVDLPYEDNFPFVVGSLDISLFRMGAILKDAKNEVSAVGSTLHFFLVNSEIYGHPGFHWISVVMEVVRE